VSPQRHPCIDDSLLRFFNDDGVSRSRYRIVGLEDLESDAQEVGDHRKRHGHEGDIGTGVHEKL
jgi:hypothetical protein